MNDPSLSEDTIDQPEDLDFLPSVTVMSGKNSGQRAFMDEKRLVMGRSKDTDLQIDSRRVSRNHAEIRSEEGVFLLVDLNSKWGTLKDGERITESVIKYGEEFEIAGIRLKFDMAAKGDGEEEVGHRRRVSVITILLVLALIAAATLFYFRHMTKTNLAQPGGDVLTKIMYHYDKGIEHYNKAMYSDDGDMTLVVLEMKKVIELDPESKTKFSKSARRIIDGLEDTDNTRNQQPPEDTK